jgi:hypothetical protein
MVSVPNMNSASPKSIEYVPVAPFRNGGTVAGLLQLLASTSISIVLVKKEEAMIVAIHKTKNNR